MDQTIFVPMTKEQMGIHDEFKNVVARLVLKWQRMHFLSETDRRRLMLSLSQMRMVCDSTIINLDLPWNPAVLEQRIARIYRIGQQRNIQVINLVAAHTIEESMIGKLKFKTSLFEGVLDGGDDAVFASDDKFAKIMDLVGEYVEPSAKEHQSDDSGTTVDTSEVEQSAIQPEARGSSEGGTTQIGQTGPATPAVSSAPVVDPVAEDEDNASPAESGDLINQGLSFFSNLVETLKSPEKSAKLIDKIVVDDKETGKSSINIPIQSKQHITDALAIIGKLLAK